MKLISPAFKHMEEVPAKYTCDGENIHPPLVISQAPEGASSLALIMEDPDVPRSIRPDGMWDHWVAWNIPITIHDIREGEVFASMEGMNTGGTTGYTGPCPPDREHRYFFKLYALDTMLDLPAKTGKKELEDAMEGHVLDCVELVGVYGADRRKYK